MGVYIQFLKKNKFAVGLADSANKPFLYQVYKPEEEQYKVEFEQEEVEDSVMATNH